MDKEQIKQEINKRYAGKKIYPSDIIDIVIEAIELSRQREYPKEIGYQDKISGEIKLFPDYTENSKNDKNKKS